MFGDAYGPRVRGLFSDNDSKKGCFSMSIEANKSNPFLWIQLKTGTLKKNLRTKAFMKIFYTDHIFYNGKAGGSFY
jgi:hypothetical protein